MQHKRLWLLLTLLVVVAAASTLGACGSSASASTSSDVQFLAPQELSVADYAGKPLVINYFGSWCGPCNAEAPALAVFSKAQSGKAVVVGIAVNDSQSDVIDFMSRYGLTYPVVLDDNSLGAKDGITGVPTTIFYDASGREVDRIIGAASLERFNTSFAKTQ